jgi:hypothetical protein
MKTTESQRRHVGKWRGAADKSTETMDALRRQNTITELGSALSAIGRALILCRGTPLAADIARLVEMAAATLDLVGVEDLKEACIATHYEEFADDDAENGL